MNISDARQVKMMEREMRITRKTSELTKKRKIDNHKRASLLEDIRMAKSCGLTLEDIS